MLLLRESVQPRRVGLIVCAERAAVSAICCHRLLFLSVSYHFIFTYDYWKKETAFLLLYSGSQRKAE